jgi:RNA polymerase sigma factor (sigma-70 family)
MQGCVTSGAGAAWDEQAATAMVRAAVKRKRGMFSHYADLSDEDLVQSVLIEVRKAFPTFNPDKATFSTWVGMVAGRRLIDAWRHRDRQANRDAIGAVREKTVGPPEIDDGPDPEPQLHEWLREVYQAARRTFTEKRLRQGRRFHNVAQEVASRARVAAANALLDRAWGKAAQAVHVTAETPQAVAILFPTLPARSE